MAPRVPARVSIALAAVLVLMAVAGVVRSSQPIEDPQSSYDGSQAAETSVTASTRILGATPSGLAWHSGVWLGGRFSPSSIQQFGRWRGRPVDVATTFGSRGSFEALTRDVWPIDTWSGFAGKLSFALPLLPEDGEGSLASIAAGQQDHVWSTVAQNLVDRRRGDSIIRLGWESNLQDWPWHVEAATAPQFRDAFRRVVEVMRRRAPHLTFEFGVNCGSGLSGSADRLAPLTMVYPGDDVVDLIGCDTYDWYGTHADSDATWPRVLRPAAGPGIADIVDFARLHGKGASFGEWGLAHDDGVNGGGGDNPYYVNAMFAFFTANSDVIAYECYFDEPHADMRNSLVVGGQDARSSAVYRALW